MDMDILLQYVELMNQHEELVSGTDSFSHLTAKERETLGKVKEMSSRDIRMYRLSKKLREAPPSERKKIVDDFFAKNIENSDKEEEVISKTFGIDVHKIRHKYLSSGKDLFCFYDDNLGREVVLENGQKGKSLISQLKEIQEEEEKFQTEDDAANAHDILMDERNRKNLELEFLSKEETLDRLSVMGGMRDEDLKKIHYLLYHYDRLQITGINIEDMVFIDSNYEIHEVTLDENENVIITTPSEDKGESNVMEEESSIQEEPVSVSKEEVVSTEGDDLIQDDDSIISKVFGVPADEVKRRLLSNGMEIFILYSALLGREVLLKGEYAGESLIDYLNQHQDINQNSEDKDNPFEFQFITKEEATRKLLMNENLNEIDSKKLDYLLTTDNANIGRIDLENFVYLDKENHAHEICFNDKGEVHIVDFDKDPKEKELDQIFEDDKKDDDFSLIDTEAYVDTTVEQKEKPKVYTKTIKDQEVGFVDGLLFVVITTFSFLLVCITYLFIRLLIHS